MNSNGKKSFKKTVSQHLNIVESGCLLICNLFLFGLIKMKKQKHFPVVKLLIICFIFISIVSATNECLAGTRSTSQAFSKKERQHLIQLFENSDYDIAVISKLFFDPRLKKMPVLVDKNVKNKEIKSNYAEFLSPYSLHIANRFAKKWRTLLDRASRKFGVDSEILVAVLLVETGFGNVLGRYPIVSVYASILTENQKQQKRCVLRNMHGCLDSPSLSRLKTKAKWAEKELKALVKIAIETNHNLFRLKGSYAGAFGIPQFLPSSYLKWGYDSDRNGSVNLFLFPDAVFSTANYLKGHGWQKGLHHKSNLDVIWAYNHSQVYVNTIFKVAKKVKIYPSRATAKSPKVEKPQITLNNQKQRTNNSS